RPDLMRSRRSQRLASRFCAYSTAVTPSIPGAPSLRVSRWASLIHSRSRTWCSVDNATPLFVLASSAIRCRFVDRFARLKVLSRVSPQRFSPAAPPFPRLGPGEPGSPTSWALGGRYDPPSPHHRSLIWFASGAHAIPPRFVLAAASAPERVEVPHRARIIVRPAIPIAGSLPRGREWDISGSQAIHPLPLPRSSTPAGPTSPRHSGLIGVAPAR